jgi:hypothetical protein
MKKTQETYSIVLQLPDVLIQDLAPCANQSYRMEPANETALIETLAKNEMRFLLPPISWNSIMDDLEHIIRPMFKFEEYTIIERDSSTDFPVVSPSIDERQFLSILQDECFLSEPADIHNNCIADPVAAASAAARDPFHADWPYWDRAT